MTDSAKEHQPESPAHRHRCGDAARRLSGDPHGVLPVFRQLLDAGDMHERSVTIIPSITPAATTSTSSSVYSGITPTDAQQFEKIRDLGSKMQDSRCGM